MIQKKMLLVPMLVVLSTFLIVGSASALSYHLDYGADLELIDGNGGNLTITNVSLAGTDLAGYYINDDPTWHPFLPYFPMQFDGGSVLRLALNGGAVGLDEVTAMDFTGLDGYDWYQSVTTAWGGGTLTLSFSAGNIVLPPDGIKPVEAAPTPEPTSLLLFGSIMATGFFMGKKKDES